MVRLRVRVHEERCSRRRRWNGISSERVGTPNAVLTVASQEFYRAYVLTQDSQGSQKVSHLSAPKTVVAGKKLAGHRPFVAISPVVADGEVFEFLAPTNKIVPG